MRISYLPGKSKTPLPSLGGRHTRFRPITAVRITGPSGGQLMDGLLDTGADDTIFPDCVATMAGLDLNAGVACDVSLAGRDKVIRCRYLPVRLRITDGKRETYEWDAVVGFVALPLKMPLLGHAGFLEFFDAEFQGADRVVVLVPNRSFSGKRI